jgi:hypothetical protein
MFSGFATLVVGLGVIFIAWQQWKVAHAKLRLDLFDRRYKVYEATRYFLAGLLSCPTFSDSQLFTFYAGTSDVEFLFDSKVVDYLSQIRNRAIDMRLQNELFRGLPDGPERSAKIEAAHQHSLWLCEQLTSKTLTKTFAPHLGFSNIR